MDSNNFHILHMNPNFLYDKIHEQLTNNYPIYIEIKSDFFYL